MLTDLDLRLKILAIFTALVFIIIVIALVKKRLLKENWAILWIIFAFALALLAINFNFVRWISSAIGVKDPNNMLFFLSIVFLTLIVIMASIDISDMQKKIKNMTQEISVLKNLAARKGPRGKA